MDPRINRPVVVCVAQALLILFSLLLLIALAASLTILSMNFREGMPIAGLVYLHSAIAGLVLVFLIAFRGLLKRKMYAKWLAVLSLILFWSLIIFESLRDLQQYYGYENTWQLGSAFWQLAGATIFHVLVHSGFLVLIISLVFSREVNQFFKQEV